MVPRLTGGKRLLRWLFKAVATSASKYRHCYNVLSVMSYFLLPFYQCTSIWSVKRKRTVQDRVDVATRKVNRDIPAHHRGS